MLERCHKVTGLIALEGHGLDDLSDTVLEFTGLRRQRVVILGVTPGMGMCLEGDELFPGCMTLRTSSRQHRLNMLDFFAIRQLRIEGNGLNRLQRAHRALLDTGHECLYRTAMLRACRIIRVLVVPFAGIEYVLDDFEQDIHKRVLQTVELMRDEAHQMEIPIVIRPTRDLKHLGFQHRVGIVAYPVRRQVQRGNDGSQLLVEQA